MTRLATFAGLLCMGNRAGMLEVATEPEPGSTVMQLDAAAELREFVATHHGRLIRLATLVSHSIDEAEDAVQAALERAWRQRHTLADRSRLRPWLDRIVVREAIRATSRHRPTGMSAAPSYVADSSHEVAAVHLALDELSPAHRAVVVLHLYAGYSVADTAAALGIPVETARSRLRVARERLRRLLGEEG